jgi:potassium-transporting ATPase potassium-binding subunit
VTAIGIIQLLVFVAVLVAAARPFGSYMARVYGDENFGRRRFGAGERGFLRLFGGAREQDWKAYARSVILFTLVFSGFLYLLLRLQGHLPLNPDGFKGVVPGVAANTTASFLTNTNWQFYAGETTMSYLSQMAGLAVQNFVSAAVGMAVLVAVIRGFSRRSSRTLGNFWVDLYKTIAYILVPLSIVASLVLVSQGVVQTFSGHATATTLEGSEQLIARGPVASQIAIKHVGTNGGGFYNSNSAVPFESPTAFTGYFELFLELLIPFALIFMFGRMIGSMRQAWAIFAAMFALFAVAVAIEYPAEQHGSQVLRDSGVGLASGSGAPGGNFEGKEIRYGLAESSIFVVGTTVTSTGAVVAGHDSLTALGGAVPIVNMFVGEVVFGGVGSGLYGMLLYVLLAVFIAGLMVGRTPEYLGKKIGAREVKLAIVGTIFVPSLVLVLTAMSVVLDHGLASIFNPGAHGFSEALYAYTSQTNNNGSAFAGYGALDYSEFMGAMAMLLGRFVPLIAALAVAGSLAGRTSAPASAGTFRTDTPTFVVLLAGVIIIVAGLTIFPALALGPLVEALTGGTP